MEGGTCYVCLEECVTKSPCQCAQPLHLHCFLELQNTDTQCTICKSRFDLPIQPPQSDNEDPHPPQDEDLCADPCVDPPQDDDVSEWVDVLTLAPIVLFWSFCFYLLSGYCGKCFLLPFWNSGWSEFFIFWTVKHLLCCIGFTVLMNIIIQVYALLKV